MKLDHADRLRVLANMAQAKTAEYSSRSGGDAITLHGAIMRALFPAGIKVASTDDFNRYHLLVQMVVKLARYVQNWDKGGHADSLKDLAVYAAMLESLDDGIREEAAAAEPKRFSGKVATGNQNDWVDTDKSLRKTNAEIRNW